MSLQLPDINYNQKEIESMTPQDFKLIVSSFWDQVSDTITKEEFVALSTALAVRKVRKNGLVPRIDVIRNLIREAINENGFAPKNQNTCKVYN